jgi:GNAT superfamily N-acetyltransferase
MPIELNPENISIRLANSNDFDNIALHDHHIATDLLAHKIDRQEVIVAYDGESLADWLRWSLFWDNTPFMNLLFLLPEYRGAGTGRQLVQFWEEKMSAQGYRTLMTSTQQNETAQHFYTHLGYRAVGGFVQSGGDYEIIFVKEVEAKYHAR